ncbi:hypothetical protein [Methylococcus capsulatus]|uniref:hypothetical protein n=1 Tax=Methylococcus capsulatus TaxID=414 RepID=UPI0002DE3617|nr:hypothetical protein [Methylococcus capsulatus]QXP93048.1 hypothetical protein KW113_11845 [Methylococcus capsulatus]
MTPDLYAKLALQIAHTTATLETLVQDVLDVRARLIRQASPERDLELLLAELRTEFDQSRQENMRAFVTFLQSAPETGSDS